MGDATASMACRERPLWRSIVVRTEVESLIRAARNATEGVPYRMVQPRSYDGDSGGRTEEFRQVDPPLLLVFHQLEAEFHPLQPPEDLRQ